jgi:hypothetical protein
VADSGKVELSRSSRRGLKEFRMHDLCVGMIFVAMVIAPCVVALRVRLED